MTKPLRIIQMSDTHLLADSNGELLGVNTLESYCEVVKYIIENDKLELLILTGDLSQDGSEKSYRVVADTLQPIMVPTYCVPGNHDNLAAMLRIYPRANIICERHILLDNWQIILLDTQKVGSVGGYMRQAELNFLQQCLQLHYTKNTAIMMHHHPVKIGCRWLDNIGIENASAFWDVLANHQNVKGIFYSHIHQENEQLMHGIKCYSTPSTCIQFNGHHDDFGLENLPPGYRWIEFFEDGTYKTGIQRLSHYVGNFDAEAKGY